MAQPDCAGCLLGNLIVDLVEQDESFREHLTRVFDEWEWAIAAKIANSDEYLMAIVSKEFAGMSRRRSAHYIGLEGSNTFSCI